MKNTRIQALLEELDAQRIMLEDSLTALESKNEVLEKTNYVLQEKQFELEQFIYRLHHDFKSPISTIKGLIDLLEVDIDGMKIILTKMKDTVHRFDTILASISYYYISNHDSDLTAGVQLIFEESMAK